MAEKQNIKKPNNFLLWMALFMLAYLVFLPREQTAPTEQNPETEHIDISEVPKLTLADDKIAATVQGIRITNINLNDYKAERGEMENIELLANENEFVEVGLLANGTTAPTAAAMWRSTRGLMPVMMWKGAGADFRRTVSAADYVITVSDEIRNTGKKPISVSQYSRIVQDGGEDSRFAVKTGGIANIAGDIETEDWDGMSRRPPIWQTAAEQDSFAGFSDQYWQVIAASTQQSDKTIKIKQRADKMFQAETAPEFQTIEPGKSATFTTEIFAGPKTQQALAAASVKISGIDRTLDYGWFGILSRPFLWTLNQLFSIVGSYGIAIIILTLIIRGLMWPLTKKSYKSMATMQKMQPEMKRIQALYGNDKVRMQQEIMRLYQTHRTGPFGGIGIMFLQIPIFFALYKALIIAVPLRHASFLWLPDLSVMDPYFILPAIMAVSMWYQNRLTGSGQADMPGMRMMRYMPFMFAFLFAWMPSGLVLYWTVSNIVGIIQLKIMKK